MKKLFLLSLVILLSLSMVSAEGIEELLIEGTSDLSGQERIDAQKEILIDNVDLLAEEINPDLKNLPEIFQKIVGDTQINVYFDSGETLGIIVEDSQIVSASSQALEDPTFDVVMSDHVFEDLNTGVFDVKTALKKGDITYEGKGFWGNMKSGLLTSALKILL